MGYYPGLVREPKGKARHYEVIKERVVLAVGSEECKGAMRAVPYLKDVEVGILRKEASNPDVRIYAGEREMQWTSRLAHCDCSYPIYIGPLGRNANLRALDIEWRKRGWSGWICRPCRHRRSLGNGSMTGNGVTINRVNSLGVPSLLVVLCGMCAGPACSEQGDGTLRSAVNCRWLLP